MNYLNKHILITGMEYFLKKNMAVYMHFSWNTDIPGDRIPSSFFMISFSSANYTK